MEITWKYDEPLSSDALLNEFEDKTDYKLPESFRELVINHNGAIPSMKIFNTEDQNGHVFGYMLSFNKEDTKNLNIWETNKTIPKDVDSKYVAFAMDAFGNWICFNCEDNSIVFVDHDSHEVEQIANSFDEFVNSLYNDENNVLKEDETPEDETAEEDPSVQDEESASQEETNEPESETYDESYEIELDEDDLVTESMGVENFNNLRSQIQSSESSRCSVTPVINDRFKVKLNNGKNDYFEIINNQHNHIRILGHFGSKHKIITNDDMISNAVSIIRNTIDRLFGKFHIVTESYSSISFNGFSRFMEATEDTLSDEELESFDDFEEEESNKEPQTDESTNDTDDTEDDSVDFNFSSDDLEPMSFDEPDSYIIGSDESDEQNDYDPAELDTLNKLIASETSATSEYLDANKATKVPLLSKLYADIGDEERFHTEQLLYAKAELTGETYEPRDPEVKKEYEELKALGMDSETAMTTAFDRLSISSDEPTDEEVTEEFEEAYIALEYALTTNELYSIIMESKSKVNIQRSATIIAEAYFMEAIDTNDSNAKVKLPIDINPLKLIYKLIKGIIRGVSTIGAKFRKWSERSYRKRRLRLAWIKKHGIKALFEKGIHLYFYDEERPDLDMLTVFYQLIGRMDAAVAAVIRPLNGEVKYTRLSNPTGKTFNFGTPKQAIQALKNIHLMKTKVIVNDKTAPVLEAKFFGVTDEKFGSDDNRKSYNEYNKFESCLEYAKKFLEMINHVADEVQALGNNNNSIYYKNPKLFNETVSYLEDIVKTCNSVIKALSHDLGEYVKVNNNCTMEATAEADRQASTPQSDGDNSNPIADVNGGNGS